MGEHPRLAQVVLDATDIRALAAFYRELLGWSDRPGDEPPAPEATDDPADDPNEPLYVVADPAGHPFCVFVG